MQLQEKLRVAVTTEIRVADVLLDLPPYVVPGVNGGEERLLPPGVLDARVQQERLTVGNVSDEKLINIIGQLMATYKKYVEGQIELEPLEHTVKHPPAALAVHCCPSYRFWRMSLITLSMVRVSSSTSSRTRVSWAR